MAPGSPTQRERSSSGDGVIMHRLLGRVLGERDQEADCWFETVEEALGAVEPLLFPEE